MLRTMLKGKIHRLTVTDADPHYVGSISLDSALMEAAGILPHEQVHVVNVTNGERLATYAIAAEAGSGRCCMNGAAAHKAHPGDIVIVINYCILDEAEARQHDPVVVHVDARNAIVEVKRISQESTTIYE